MMNKSVIALTFALALGGCVKKSVHEDMMAQMAQDYSTMESQLQGELSESRATLSERDSALAACTVETSRLSTALEMTEGELLTCRQRLADARGMISQSDEAVAALARRLEELSSIEAELRERDAIFRDIVEAFSELIQNGYVEVAIERGRLVIKMPQDILFESGSADIGPTGSQALIEVAGVLAALDERQFQVEGHTDNVPIASRRFPSNWELSAARALAVVHLFETSGVPPQNVSAGAFGEFQPRGSNETPADRENNRRIEIVMVPNLEAIFGGISPAVN